MHTQRIIDQIFNIFYSYDSLTEDEKIESDMLIIENLNILEKHEIKIENILDEEGYNLFYPAISNKRIKIINYLLDRNRCTGYTDNQKKLILDEAENFAKDNDEISKKISANIKEKFLYIGLEEISRDIYCRKFTPQNCKKQEKKEKYNAKDEYLKTLRPRRKNKNMEKSLD